MKKKCIILPKYFSRRPKMFVGTLIFLVFSKFSTYGKGKLVLVSY